jgi:hypothetical protein
VVLFRHGALNIPEQLLASRLIELDEEHSVSGVAVHTQFHTIEGNSCVPLRPDSSRSVAFFKYFTQCCMKAGQQTKHPWNVGSRDAFCIRVGWTARAQGGRFIDTVVRD